jgi:hypothetical protein
MPLEHSLPYEMTDILQSCDRLLNPWDDLRASAYTVLHAPSDEQAAATVVWAPPWPPAAPLLPGEVDTVRLLHVTLHALHAFAATAEQPVASAMNAAGSEVVGASGTLSAAASMLLQVGI